MSEYQYYEFQAIDRPLDQAAQDTLRSISSRARITATSFINHYEWGDLKGDPRKFMERWFDLHLYLANWGTRRLMLRVPARFVKRKDIDRFLGKIDWVHVWTSGDSLIVDVQRDEDGGYDDWDDGSSRLAALAPLRTDLLSGDLRLFYLPWLAAVQDDLIPDDEVEPLAGIAPLTGALEAFAEFFCIDADLVQAAVELDADAPAMSKDDLRKTLAAIPEPEKVELLLRVADGEAYVGAELRSRFRKKAPAPPGHRTAGTLRMRAQEIREARERAEAERRETERRRRAAEAEKARRVRLKALKQRGASVWREIEDGIERRNPAGYDQAMSLLSDLQVLAVEEGSQEDFNSRIGSIRARHEKKGKFIERLNKLGHEDDEEIA
ncbi:MULTISPECIES: hypothetical protein [unclassified Bradyrhizobium]|uniref:hypothetical protein n=1 Tax=unclassified Bradyrhizobium TaxID=2631580 RepID=UPI002479D711|nr:MULTISPECIES: hypothetical protein [unclassified Bradyrhizobium]WGS19467.1 hypothetical protein MTX22_34635 [Bradyrhizobium sp. ISRA463]WGS26305.1 hypothetical protein MTX19_32125 [Bradyrhizobium sp. ISRA464]